MAISIEQIRLITIRAQTQGVAQAQADLDKLASAQTNVATSATGMATTTDTASGSASRLAANAQGLLRAVDPLYAAQTKLESRQATLSRAFDQGALSSSQMARALLGTQQAYDAVAAKAQAAAAAASAASARMRAEETSQRASAQVNINQQYGVRDDFDSESRAADIKAYGEELDRVRAKFSPLFAVQQAYESTLSEINAAAKAGALTEIERAAAIANAEKVEKAARAAIEEHTGSLVLNRMQMMESMHVTKSLADSIIATGQPFRALAMESGRIFEIFESGEHGVGGTLKAMGSAVGGLLTGWVGLAAGVVGGLAVAGAAVLRFQSQQDKLAVSLNGVGRAAGVSLGGLTAIANNAAATTPGMSQGAATGLAAGFAHAGLGGGVIQSALGATKAYSNATGQDLATSGAELAKALADPAKGADELNSKLGFLDGTTRQLIESMTRSGDVLGAQRLLLDKVGESTKNATDRAYWYQKAWEGVAGAVGTALDKIGTLGQSGPLEDQRAALQRQLSDLQSPLAFGDAGSRGDQIRVLTEEIAALTDAIRAQNKQVGADATDQQMQKLSLQAADAVRAADPMAAKSQELSDNIRLLTEAFYNQDISSRVPGGTVAIQRSLGFMTTERANLDPMLRQQQDSALQIASIQAVTLAQKESVAALQAELSVRRQSNNLVLAAAAAEAKRNEMLAQAQREIDDATRSAGRDLKYSGMSPYDAARARVNDEMDDFNRLHNMSARPPGVSALDMSMTALDTGGLADKGLLNYSRNIAPNADAMWASYLQKTSPVSATVAAPSASALVPANSNVPRASSGYTGDTSQMRADKLALIDVQMQALPLKEANQALDAQNALLAIQANAGDKSTAAVQGLLDKQKLLNQYNKDGIPITAAVSAGLDAYAQKATIAAQAQEALQQKIQALDSIRSGVDSGMQTFVDDLVQGKKASEALSDALKGLASAMLNAALNSTTTALLGKTGTTQTGLLGGLFSGLLGSGAATGGVGSFVNGFGAAPVFAASGGPIAGPGGPRSDSIPAMLSNGEYVVNANSTSRYRPLLDHINGYADGGPVVPMRAMARGGGDTHNYRAGDVHIHFGGSPGDLSEAQMRTVQGMVARGVAQGQAASAKGFQNSVLPVSASQRLLVG